MAGEHNARPFKISYARPVPGSADATSDSRSAIEVGLRDRVGSRLNLRQDTGERSDNRLSLFEVNRYMVRAPLMANDRLFNPFDAEAERLIRDAYVWSGETFVGAEADLAGVSVTAAHVAGYGKCVAHAQRKSGVVALTLGNRFSVVKQSRSGGLAPKGDGRALWGLVVHELGRVPINGIPMTSHL